MKRLLVATTNPGKQGEFRRLLGPLAAEIVTPGAIGLDLEVDEPYDTYLENAVVKASAYSRRVRAGERRGRLRDRGRRTRLGTRREERALGR